MRKNLPGRGYPALFFVIDGGQLRLMGRSAAFDAYRAEKVEFPPTIIKPTRDEWEDHLLDKKAVTRPWKAAESSPSEIADGKTKLPIGSAKGGTGKPPAGGAKGTGPKE